jgi:hypothetical protein
MNLKVDLFLFLFIVILWDILIDKCIILNTVLLYQNVMILSSVYVILLCDKFFLILLMSSIQTAMINTFDKCDLFDKAVQLSVIVRNNKSNNNESVLIKNCRSRYEKFVYFSRRCHTHAVRVRDRKPSRIPKKRIARILHKSRKVRRLLRTHIKKNIPKSSGMHIFIKKGNGKMYTHNIRCWHKGKMRYPSSAVRRKYNRFLSSHQRNRKSNKHRIKLESNYPDTVIKSSTPKRLNAWGSNSIPAVYKI